MFFYALQKYWYSLKTSKKNYFYPILNILIMKTFSYFITVCLILFSGCKSNGGGGDPKKVLSQFFEALYVKDIQTAKKYATEDSKSMLDMMETGFKMGKEESQAEDIFSPKDMQYGEVKFDGDIASVPVKSSKAGEKINFTLKKEKGDWKVAFDMITVVTMGMEKMREKGINPLDSVSKGLTVGEFKHVKLG